MSKSDPLTLLINNNEILLPYEYAQVWSDYDAPGEGLTHALRHDSGFDAVLVWRYDMRPTHHRVLWGNHPPLPTAGRLTVEASYDQHLPARILVKITPPVGLPLRGCIRPEVLLSLLPYWQDNGVEVVDVAPIINQTSGGFTTYKLHVKAAAQ